MYLLPALWPPLRHHVLLVRSHQPHLISVELALPETEPARSQADWVSSFDWLGAYGLDRSEVTRLLPTVPGGLTSAKSYYVNSLIPDRIFRGREQGSLPMTPGRWFLIPYELVESHPALVENPLPPATARSLLPWNDTRTLSAWTSGG